jgi:hypothetical protein
VAADAAEQNGGIELGDLNRFKPQSFWIYTPRWMTEYLTNWIYCDTANVYVQTERKVHGLGRLPKGYRLAYVPRDAVVAFKWDEDPPTPENSGEYSWSISLFFSKIWELVKTTGTAIKAWFRTLRSPVPMEQEKSGFVSSSYALPKVLIALFQLVYGALSLANSRGDQINRFGYAAFGLTVTVYTVMAGINLIGHLLTPDYSTLFVVHNEVLEEIMQRPDLPNVDKRFADGVVGRLIAADDEYRTSNYQPRRLFHGRFTDVAELQGATFQVAPEVNGLPEPAWVLRPRGKYSERSEQWRTNRLSLANPAVQIPACPLFKRKRQLYGSPSRPSITSIGRLVGGRERLEEGTNPQPRLKAFYGYHVYAGAVILVGLLCFTIIASFSQMNNYKSTQAQRGWTMSWFIFGIFAGYTIPLGAFNATLSFPLSPADKPIDDFQERYPQWSVWTNFAYLLYVVPTIGGLVVVAQMINAYGNCVKLE